MRNIYFRAGMLFFFFGFSQILWAQQASILKNINNNPDNRGYRLVYFDPITATDNHLFFGAGGCYETPELYALDRNDSIYMPLNILREEPNQLYYCSPDPTFSWARPDVLGTLADKIFFRPQQNDTGKELWVSDGTTQGTLLLKDVIPGAESAFPGAGYTFKDKFWFTAKGDSLDDKLWHSDGTTEGTKPAGSVNPEKTDIGGVFFASDDKWLYFTTYSNSLGFRLWRTDGSGNAPEMLTNFTEPTWWIINMQLIEGNLYLIKKSSTPNIAYTKIIKIDPQNFNSTQLVLFVYPSDTYKNVPRKLYPLNGKIYFPGIDFTGKETVWETDGTSAGTKMNLDVPLWYNFDSAENMAVFDDHLYFFTQEVGKYQFMKYGGSPGTLEVLKDFSLPPYFNPQFTEWQQQLWWSYRGQQIWKTDGTVSGTTIAIDSFENLRSITLFNDRVYFLANRKNKPATAWYFDQGNNHTPVQVKSNGLANLSSDISDFAILKDEAYFWAQDTFKRTEIWTTNGMPSSVHQITDLSFFNGGYDFTPQPVNDSLLLFTTQGPDKQRSVWATNTSFNNESTILELPLQEHTLQLYGLPEFKTAFFNSSSKVLYQSEGTAATTVPVLDNVGPISTPVFFQDRFFMTAVRNDTLWLLSSDGTPEHTTLEIPLAATNHYSAYPLLKIMDEHIYFFKEENGKWNLWKSDGNLQNTQWITAFEHEPGNFPGQITVSGDLLYFTCQSALWRSDGTSAGTYRIDNQSYNKVYDILGFRDELYFTAYSDNNGTEIWKSDGSLEGTVLLKDILPGIRSSEPDLSDAASLGDYFWFPAFTEQYGEELWQSDGTPEGTRLAADICPGPCSGQPKRLKIVNNRHLLFSAYTPETGIEPWTIDVLKLNEPPVLRGPACRIDAQVIPNPATTSATLYFPDNTGQITRYRTLDASGKTKAEGSIAPSAVSIDINLQGTPNGLYFIQLLDQSGGVLCTQRLVVQQ